MVVKYCMHLAEIQSGFCLYLWSGFKVFKQIWSSDKKYEKNIWYPILKIWKICACAKHNYSLMHIIHKLPNIIWTLNLQWGYYLTNEGGQLVHVIFSKKDILDWKFHTDLLVNVLRPSLNFMACPLVDKSSMELHTRKYFLKKSCAHL